MSMDKISKVKSDNVAGICLTHTLTHTGKAQSGQASSERTTTSGFSVKKGKKSYSRNGKYRF